MAWTKSGKVASGDYVEDKYGASALHVIYRTPAIPEPHSVAATSWSPVLLRDGGPDDRPYKMRLYGLVPQDFLTTGGGDAGAPFLGGYTLSPAVSPWGERHARFGEKRVGFLESTKPYVYDHFPGVIVVDKKSPTTVLHETCIFNEIQGLEFTYTVLNLAAATSVRSGPFDTTCGECQFLELPDKQGFLMVFQQYLYDSSEGGYSPYNSRTQIVGWWSDSKSFTSKSTVGPFLLVGDLDCLPNQSGFRMWVGVPGVAALREADNSIGLYLYYIVERCEVGYHLDPQGPLRDSLSRVQYDSALDEWAEHETLAGQFIPGVYCKRIDWDWFQSHYICPELAATAPLDTTNIALWDTRDAVDGELLGMVNFWIEDGDVEPFSIHLPVKPFFSIFHPRYARFKAPHPVTCDLSSSALSLYTAVTIADGSGPAYRPTPPQRTSGAEGGGEPTEYDWTPDLGMTKRLDAGRVGSGHGIWRGRALPESRLLYNTLTGAPFGVKAGRDFVFSRIERSSNRSHDMVAASDQESVYIDPGPVQLEDGTWWVIAGRQTPSSPTFVDGELRTSAPGLGEMVAFAGTEADGCGTWADLYPSSSTAAARAARRVPPAIRVAQAHGPEQNEAPRMTGDQVRASLLKSG